MSLYGCHNTERSMAYVVPVRIPYLQNSFCHTFNVYQPEIVLDTSSKECQYRKLTPDDVRCTGCKK